MNKMKLALTLLSLVWLSGCAALTDSQRKTVATYAKLTQAYTQYPSEVGKVYVSLNYEVVTMPLAFSQSDDGKVHDNMLTNLALFERGNQNSQRVDDVIGVLRQYAKSLEALSTAELPDNVGKNAELLGKTLDGAVTAFNTTYKPATSLPVGFGKLIGDAISLIGKRHINHRQAVALRQYMSKGDTLMQLLDKDTQLAFRDLTSRWVLQKELIKAQHTSLLQQMHAQDQSAKTFYAYQINKDVVGLIGRVATFDKLLASTPKAMSEVYQAHHSVFNDIQQKRAARDQIADIQQLYENITKLQSESQKLTSSAAQ